MASERNNEEASRKRRTRLRKATARQATTSRAARGEVFRRNPYKIDGRALFYARSIGTDGGFADIIIEQATKFDSEGSRRGGTG